jgi:predicted secreted protein
VKAALSEAKQLVAALGPAGDSLKEMLKTADGLFARYNSMNKPSAAAESRPFDIREYTEAMKELAVTMGRVNEVLKSSNELLGSPEWNRRVQEINNAADARVRDAAEQSHQLVKKLFWRVYAALGMLFVILIICLAVAFVLARRLMKAGSAPNAGGAGREGIRQ